MIYIHIVCGTGRALKNKIALYKSIAEKIVAGTGITSDDVFIVLSETSWENWSFGRGEAQKVKIFGQ
jgi:hypothetical protein